MDNAEPDRGHFLNIVGCCNFTEAKCREMCTVYWTMVYFSKTERHLQQNAPSGPRVLWNCRSRVSFFVFSWLDAWSDFGSNVCKIRPFIKYRSYKVAYSFWLCIRIKCLSICAPSFVAIVRCDWALWDIAFGARTTPRFVSHNLNSMHEDRENFAVKIISGLRPTAKFKQLYRTNHENLTPRFFLRKLFLTWKFPDLR